MALDAVVTDKWVGLQLDKQGSLLVRAHTAFVQKAANITYGGILSAADILRPVAQNSSPLADTVQQAFTSAIAIPI